VSKQIQYAGYSIVKDGTWKFRTATDEKRIAQLEAFGESVYMVSIRPVDTKGAAAKELLAMDYMGKDQACMAFFVKHARDENPFKPKKARTVKVKRSELVEDDDVRLTPKQAAKIRAEFCERVRQAYEAN
jgi:VCBS repeat-containing protein